MSCHIRFTYRGRADVVREGTYCCCSGSRSLAAVQLKSPGQLGGGMGGGIKRRDEKRRDRMMKGGGG